MNLLLRKHDDVSDELANFDTHIQSLHQKAEALPLEAREHPDIRSRLETTVRRSVSFTQNTQLH